MTDLDDSFSKIKTYVNGDMFRAAEVLDLVGEPSDNRVRYRFSYIVCHDILDIDEIDRQGQLGWDVVNVSTVKTLDYFEKSINEFHVLMRKPFQLPSPVQNNE